MHAQVVIHRRTDQWEYCSQDRSHDDGGCDGACAVDCVAVHEVLDKTGHDLGDTYAEWNSCENWHYPMYRWKSRPDTHGEELRIEDLWEQERTMRTRRVPQDIGWPLAWGGRDDCSTTVR